MVYSLTPPVTGGGKWTETILHNFQGGVDGALPSGVAVGSDGVLYGTTNYGGSGACSSGGLTGCGTVFSLTPPGTPGASWTETLIYSFGGGNADGSLPGAGVTIGPDGTLYGTTEYGGNAACNGLFEGCGTVFALTPPAWTETIVYKFRGVPGDGAIPLSGVALMGGVLYGTTVAGGTGSLGSGVVYELTPSATGNGWTEQVLHVFDNTDGSSPQGALLPATSPGGETVLFGTTFAGGANFAGTVFALKQTDGTWKEQVLYSFSGGADSGPVGGVVQGAGGTLFGTTFEQGTHMDGTLFNLKPNGKGQWVETVLHSFAPKGGSVPGYTLTMGPGGILYGTTDIGGGTGSGVAFSLQP